MSDSARLDTLEAEARYHRERLALYRARAYAARPTTNLRMQELQRLSESADRRLSEARREAGSAPSDE